MTTMINLTRLQEFLRPQSQFFLGCIETVESLIALGRTQESIQIIEVMLEIHPQHPRVHKNKAIVLVKHNHFQNALESLEISIKNSSDQEKSECYLYKADLLYSLQKYQESLSIYQILLQHNPNRSQILYRKGLCIVSAQKFKEAINIFNQVLSIDQNYSQCYIMNAHCLFMLKKYKKAIKCLNKVTQKNDFQNTDVLYLKASCLYNLSRFDTCKKQLNRILQIDFSHVESKVLLSLVKFKINQNQKPIRIKRFLPRKV